MISHRALSSVVACALVASSASAVPLRAEPDVESGDCAYLNAEVFRWTPGDGPPADFVARRFLEAESTVNVLVVLGTNATGVWTAERASNDACEDCSEYRLVHTSFSGARSSHLIADPQKFRSDDWEARLGEVKRRLFRLAAAEWDVPAMRHEYRLTLPLRDESGRLNSYTGWLAEVRVAAKPPIRFGVVTTSHMCWCNDAWRGYPLRA